jgi:hypothetical protein
MGRYITGDFEYKFAVGEQGSTFGMIIENLCMDSINDCNRFISNTDSGEIVTLYIYNKVDFMDSCRKFIGNNLFIKDTKDFRPTKEIFGEEYWNKYMIKLFVEQRHNFEEDEGNELTFHIEY